MILPNSPPPLILGLTGGPGTGKSTACRILAEALGCDVFDADACVHRLLGENEAVRNAIRDAFGEKSLTADGLPDRAKLRGIVFAEPAARRRLEDILHPEVQRLRRLAAEAARSSGDRLLLEIPLLYETGADREMDAVIVVGCGEKTQLQRLTGLRRLAPDLARSLVQAQMPLGRKIGACHYLVWNDGELANLTAQMNQLAVLLKG